MAPSTARVRNALATQTQAAATPAVPAGTETAPAAAGNGKPPSTAALVRMAIERQAEAFKVILPSHVDPDRFSRLVLTAVKATPDLMRCFGNPQGESSVLLAAMQAATIGLEPNTALQECWLLPRKNKGVTECQLSIGYRGYLKLARRSGTISTVFADVVHKNDDFRWRRGLIEDEFTHAPFEGGDRGPLTHAYAVARFKDGGYSFVVLSETDINKRRDMSDSYKFGKQYSPWTKWPEAMWRKSAIRALLPYLDLSVEASVALESDERQFVMNRDEGSIDVAALDEAGVLAIESGDDEDAPGEQENAPEGVDAATGEVQG